MTFTQGIYYETNMVVKGQNSKIQASTQSTKIL